MGRKPVVRSVQAARGTRRNAIGDTGFGEKEIAPHAAEVDEKARFPEEALVALNSSGFNAVHIPEEYGGQGADSVATCIVIEEVARVDASASLIPAVNKLGTMGLILRGSEELKKQVLRRWPPKGRWLPMH